MTPAFRQYTLRETADTLRVSLRTVYRLIARRELRVLRVGRRTLVRESDLLRFMDRNGG